MSRRAYVAFDLGAESGRAMLACLDGGRLDVTEVHRFANVPQRLPSGYHWNLQGLWLNLIEGLARAGRAARDGGDELVSVGVDTWGVDFGLIGRSGQLLGLPFAYRDERNGPAFEQTLQRLGRRAIYDATGIQFMPFNTLYQLVAQHAAEPGLLAQAEHLLMMPDLLHYFFCGVPTHEATDASTTQMVDPRTGRWATDLLDRLGLPGAMLGPTLPAGSVLGPILAEVAEAAGVGPIQVIAPGTHDTASAVAAVPVDTATSPPWAYLSSGTWSLMGAELAEPIVNDDAMAMGFTNERGVANRIRFLRNIAGLWLVQECRRDFAGLGTDHDYGRLTELAAAAEPFRTLLDPDHPSFASPGDMTGRIARFAESTGQPKPQAPGQFVRCCLESLALAYRRTLDGLEKLLCRRMAVLHVVGGGSRNALLNQMTADAIDRTVVAGPFEATAIGNALAQAMGDGQVSDLEHLRRIVRGTCDLSTFEPREAGAFAAQAERFAALVAGG